MGEDQEEQRKEEGNRRWAQAQSYERCREEGGRRTNAQILGVASEDKGSHEQLSDIAPQRGPVVR